MEPAQSLRSGAVAALTRKRPGIPAWLLAAVLAVALTDCAVQPPQLAPVTGVPPLAAQPPSGALPAPGAQVPSGLEAIVAAQIAAGHVPGAVVVAGDAHTIAWTYAAGARTRGPQPDPMTMDTVFDMASLTKVIATTTAVLQLVEAGRLDLDAPVARYWPAFGAHGKGNITVRELLSHTSGLPPEVPIAHAADADDVLREAADAVPVAAPGARAIYSDVNFIVLAKLVERASGERFDVWCREHIFAPLRMINTGFRPGAAPDIAPTSGLARGTVHDPIAARMGGVAGHAGLFSTAGDLARYARMLLQGGTMDGVRILGASSIALLAQPASPIDAPPWRGLGWELQAPLAANRDRLVPVGALTHTGYTGTALWIDFATGRFLIVLSNRVLMGPSGDAQPLRAQISSLVASGAPPLSEAQLAQRLPWAAATLAAARVVPHSHGPVMTGLDVLAAQGFAPLAGLRIGLVTNQSGIDGEGRRTLDVLAHAPGVELRALFAPEHGLNGAIDAPFGDTTDAATGLPVISLYGSGQRFPAHALDGLDALVFDLQDAGVRFFTYETTLGYALEAAAARGIPVFVLDRPDPLGAAHFGGPRLDAGRTSFTGYAALPLQPGMTPGELARYFNSERRIGADLHVVPMSGYHREMTFTDTGLAWTPLSPNLRTPQALALYPDVALIEGANVSVGRGTPHPFEWIGAPWIDGVALAASLNAANAGARFEPIDFVPTESAWHGVLCHGVRVVHADATRTPGMLGLTLVAVLHRAWPQTFDFAATRALIGSEDVWQALGRNVDLAQALEIARRQTRAFAPERMRYLLY
ncbi:exo-beta-N-acetylmuramidase NamZ domain-containing protein [Paraburkholderia heleia]|uniref:exo-beta-N-acetylmuramidase NamZ domain-containing protein n=1 Tax=Paraburkholderia heleia TaxID=634127 RepID=UPI0009FF5EBB